MARAQQVPVTGIHPTKGYAHAWRVGDLLFISGQIAMNTQGDVVGKGDMQEQVRQAFANVRTVLESSRATFQDVIKINIYCTDPTGVPIIRGVRAQYMGEHTPASTLVVVRALASPDYLVEIEAVAVVPEQPGGA